MNVLVPRVTVMAAIAWAITSLLVTSEALRAQDAVPAQDNAARNAARKEARKEANRFLTYLELPARRSEGAKGLLRIGEYAVPTLMRGALHPDPAIACMSMQVLGELGRAAMVAEGTLHKLSLSDNPVIASAGGWAKIRVRNQGEFLVTDYTKGQVVRYTPNQGKHDREVIFENMKSVWDAERLGNGNYLVAHYTGKKVAEYTPEGKQVWEFTDVNMPLDADRLPNGNTLICDTHGGRVLEVNKKGKIVWSHKGLKQVYDADRLVDGNTLITEFGKHVIEVDPKGKIVWTHIIKDAFGADRLPNGNTLITSYTTGDVIEIDAKGDSVLTISGLKNPNEARRLANGNTAVAENDAVRIYDPKGKMVREVKVGARPGTLNFH
ncbi:MAG: hypothetical protein ACI89X_002124 [Planctomycetota bacterium]|jgi:hypothetical protein